ncbi:VanZ family protein [uncultured Massilia sp.]|uniref:VanZ family protein n=1 Tax=uncultured Massilia sp. TaxID=169973 RepID=UPI0025D212E0|nr:VanZ family protein [uncultured Massilia sp.]
MTDLPSILLHDLRLRRLCIATATVMYLAILVAGSIPGARADIGQYASGAVLHSTAYAVLACLCFFGGGGGVLARSARAILLVAAMGAGDEFVQSFFPYRGADVRDWAVDCAAAIATCALLSLLLARVLPARAAGGRR